MGEKKAGERFIAITDPGSKMQQVAETDGFRHIFYGLPSIGGRYSALSNFGMAPAAAMGVDMPQFLNTTQEMVHACGSTVPAAENPGVVLGAILGTLGNRGRDKVTIIASPGIFDLGAWLEQLIAESTGKVGKGLIPVDRESLGAPDVYGQDRVFAYLRLESTAPRLRRIKPSMRSSAPVSRWCGLPWSKTITSARNSSAGKSRLPLRGRSLASIRSISRMSKPAKSPRAR